MALWAPSIASAAPALEWAYHVANMARNLYALQHVRRSTRTRSRYRSWVSVAVVVLVLGLTTLACGGGGGSGSPTSPRPSVFGTVGASITYLAIQGYNSIGGSRSWPDEELVAWGGAGISVWADDIGKPGSQRWGVFRSLLESEPGTDQIWWHLLVVFRTGPPPTVLSARDKELVIAVGTEIRRLAGQSTPIYVSPFPDYAPSAKCGEISQTSIEVSKLMAEFAIQQGLAQPGPKLRPITGKNNGGQEDPCHQGPVGRQQHGQDLRNFFGG